MAYNLSCMFILCDAIYQLNTINTNGVLFDNKL